MMNDDMVIRSTPEGPAAGAFKLNAKYMSGGNLSSPNEHELAVPAGLYLIQTPFHSTYSMNPTEQVVDNELYDRLIANVEVVPSTRIQSKKKSHKSAKSTRRKKS